MELDGRHHKVLDFKINQRREVADARAVFQDQKVKTGIPKAIIHDGLQSYNEVFDKEYFTLKNPEGQKHPQHINQKRGLELGLKDSTAQ